MLNHLFAHVILRVGTKNKWFLQQQQLSQYKILIVFTIIILIRLIYLLSSIYCSANSLSMLMQNVVNHYWLCEKSHEFFWWYHDIHRSWISEMQNFMTMKIFDLFLMSHSWIFINQPMVVLIIFLHLETSPICFCCI